MTRENTELAGAVKRAEAAASFWIDRHGYDAAHIRGEDLRVILSALSAAPLHEGEGEPGNHDCLAKRRPGEPMFILLGRDPDAHNVVRFWADRRLAAGGDPEHCQMGHDTADRMKAYASDPANAPASAPSASSYAAPPPSVEVERLREALESAVGTLEETRTRLRYFGKSTHLLDDEISEAQAALALSRKQEPGVPTPGGEGE